MDNNAMQGQQEYNRPPVAQAWDTARDIGSRAVSAAGAGLTRLADSTEDTVRKYPLAALGLALGAGVALGAIGTRLIMPRRRTMLERIGAFEAMKGARRLLQRVF
jgi:hypothetical protein